jgi:hypothetical protein
MVKSLKLVPCKREGEIESSMGQENIIQLGDHLITVLDPNIGPDRTSIISQLRSEPNLLTRTDRIWVHIEILNKQGAHTGYCHRPSLISSPRAKFLCDIDEPSCSLNINLYREAIFISLESVVRLREGNPIISRPEYNIIDSSYHLIPIFNKKVDPPRMPGEIRDDSLKIHPLTLPHRIRVHL